MSVSVRGSARALLQSGAIGLALLGAPALAHDPPGSSTGRSCQVAWQFIPTDPAGRPVQFPFTAHGHAPVFAHNQAREAAANAAWRCATDHWDTRLRTPPPESCRELPIESWANFVLGYPTIPNLHDEAARQLCAANPGRASVTVNIVYRIEGHEGCTTFHPPDTQLWVSGYSFNCADPAPPPPPSPPGDPAPAPPPSPPSDPAPPPPPSPPTPPGDPTALFNIFNNIRLPGHDIGTVDVADGDWQACARACAGVANCHAWTYRDLYRGTASVCLLKSAAGVPIPDSCCRSGIER